MTRNNVKLILEQGSSFTKIFMWKDKHREPINLSGYDFKCTFRYNFGDENILCTICTNDTEVNENGSLIIDAKLGQITLFLTDVLTSKLKTYDNGLWSLEYRSNTNQPYHKLIGGRWVVDAEVTK
jgi:hypothetical protein